jgi:hypothetical protein
MVDCSSRMLASINLNSFCSRKLIKNNNLLEKSLIKKEPGNVPNSFSFVVKLSVG